jgi:hypothetical protein
MAGISPTSRTLKYIRSQGWVVDTVERFNPYAGKFGQRKDMFGFGDLIAMAENSIIAIQSCGQAFAAHDKKILEDPEVAPHARMWLECGGRLMLISWRKLKLKRGGKAMRWTPRIKEYKIEDFGEIDQCINE